METKTIYFYLVELLRLSDNLFREIKNQKMKFLFWMEQTNNHSPSNTDMNSMWRHYYYWVADWLTVRLTD